jgi:uncharacterized membrane protein YbjE (DUF340 family)
MSIFEIIMMVCFGAAWPFSIWKSYKTRQTGGKSLSFLLVVLVGYTAGILNKIFYSWDNVVWLYVLNMIMVSIDTGLFLRNARYERNREKRMFL